MIRQRYCLAFASAMAALLTACSQPQPAAPPDTRATDEAAIKAADQEWSKAATAKDLDKVMSYYAEDAVLFAPKAPAFVGKGNIRKAWQSLLATPGMQMTTTPSLIIVARSGELAVERGSFRVASTDKKGKPIEETGQFVLVWNKAPDGTWKVLADTNADDK
ncbi:MAG TPA: DUF4440 domain-containing protein [Candidatus Acidoferrum sp.]|nr:DUF4440 domain-containing protein [Candidatus Acidoferrum sp.]